VSADAVPVPEVEPEALEANTTITIFVVDVAAVVANVLLYCLLHMWIILYDDRY